MSSTSPATDFRKGDRVRARAWTDRFAMGDRYGDVVKIGRKLVHVKMDRSGHTVRFIPDDLELVSF